MKDANTVKQEVRARYGAAAKANDGAAACCAPSCCGGSVSPDTGFAMNESYAGQAGYVASADLGLGCGVPTQFANLRAGETVLDLGSGAGNDAFVAAAAVGPEGKVIGVDMTPEMVGKARSLAERQGLENVSFRLGEIEHIPVEAQSIDVILSNCVLNLVPDKAQAFREMARVLRPGGRFAVSDIVFEGQMPPELKSIAEVYVGCVAGALQKEEYLSALVDAGFEDCRFAEAKDWPLDAEWIAPFLPKGLDAKQLTQGFKIIKVTVTGNKVRG